MPMTKGKLSLLLLAVAIVAVLLSGCFLPQSSDKTPPTVSVVSVIPTTSGQTFDVKVTATDPSGIKLIKAVFMNQVATATESPADFKFVAPAATQATTITLTIYAWDKKNNMATSYVSVQVWPSTQTGPLKYSISQSNTNGIYLYPRGPQEMGSILFNVNITSGANLVKSVSFYVDKTEISSPTTNSVRASGAATSTQNNFDFLYPINETTVGPHSYYAVFHLKNGTNITGQTQWFYIVYPSAQKVEIGGATLVKNGKYLTGKISLVATATDYTSKYEALLINGKTSTVLVDYSSTNILNAMAATKVVKERYVFNINTASMTDGPAAFVFKDISVDGNATEATANYIIDNTPPTLKVSYKGETATNGEKFYVGISPNYFDVYVNDANLESAKATLTNASQKLGVTLSNGATATVYVDKIAPSDGDTATFTAWAEDYAGHKSTLEIKVIRDLVPPSMGAATVTGLATYNNVPDSISKTGTITVEASVSDKNIKSVAFVLDGPRYVFPLTRVSTGLWSATINLADKNVLPGDYKASIIATDLALNEATASVVPSKIHVYAPTEKVFTTSLETTPAASVNGFVKSATITVNINPDWVYAISDIYLIKGSATAATIPATPGSATYYFGPTHFSGTGTYYVVVKDTVNATVTDGNKYVVKIDSTAPSSLKITVNSTTNLVVSGSPKFTVNATDTESGVAYFELQYKDPNSTWVTIDSTSGNDLKEATFTWYNLQTLLDGSYQIKLIAKDGVGNEASITKTVINDSEGAPKVIFTPSATLVFTNKATQTVSFVANEGDVSATLTFNGNTSSATYATFVGKQTEPSYSASWTYTFPSSNATYTYAATVKDAAGHKATHTTLFVYDTIPASIATAITSKATVAAEATFTITVYATDNFSGIDYITINGSKVEVPTSASTESKFDTIIATAATYNVTVESPSYTTSKFATYDIAVFDNAGNEATTSVAVFVDVNPPTITVKLISKNGTKTITSGNATLTVYVATSTATPASFTWNVTTDSGTNAEVAATITDLATDSQDVASAVTIPSSGTYTISIIATNPVNKLERKFSRAVKVVIDNATPDISLSATPATVTAKSEALYVNYEATDDGAAGLINDKALLTLSWNGGSATMFVPAATDATIDIFDKIKGLDNKYVTITLYATDNALNATNTSTTVYVDTIDPTITNVYKASATRLYIQISDPIATTDTFAASSIYFVQNGLTFYATNVGTNLIFNKPDGLITITELVDDNGSPVNVGTLSGEWKVYVNGVTDLAGNPIANNGSSWELHNPTSPNPNNK